MRPGEESSMGFVVPDLASMPPKKYTAPNLNFDEIRVESGNAYGTSYLMCTPRMKRGGMDIEGYSSMEKK